MKTRNRLLCLMLVLTMLLGVMPMAGAEDAERTLWIQPVGPNTTAIRFSEFTSANVGTTTYVLYYKTEAELSNPGGELDVTISSTNTNFAFEKEGPGRKLTFNSAGTYELTCSFQNGPNAETDTVTFTTTVMVSESSSDNSQNKQMYFKSYNGQSGVLMDAGTLVGAPGPGSVIGEFYIDNGCTTAVSVDSFVANDNVVVSADSSSGYKTVTLKASGDFTLTAVVDGTTYSIDVSVGSDGSLPGPPGPSGPQGNAIYIGDNYVVGFGMRDTSGALTINEGGWEMARGTSWTKAESNPLVKNWNLEVVAGTKKGDSTAAGDYSYYEEDEKATITINKVWIQLVDGDEGTFSLSGNGAVMNIDPYSSDAPTVDVHVKEGYVGGCVIWANVTATKNNGDSVTGDIGLRLRTWKDASNVYTRPANDTVEDLNAYLEDLAETVDPNSGVQSTYVVNLAPITYTGEIVIPDEFTGRHPGTCNMLQLIGASGTADCIGIGAEGCTYLNGGINAKGGHLDAVNHVHFIANESVKNAAGETAALYNGYIHNVQNCSFKGYDIVADANKGMINLSSGNILYKNDVCFRLDLGSVPYDHSRNTWQYNTFIENGTAVRFDSFNVFINPYYFRIIESNFIDNDTDFDVNTSATVYMYQNYFGDIHNQAKNAAVNNMDQFLTDLAAIRTPEQYKAQKLITSNSPNIDKVQKSKVNTSPYREKFVLSTDELPSQPGSSNPAPAAATMSLRSVSLLAEEETDYENKLVADWNLDTEILNAEADKLKIDASSFDEETENDKVISVVEVTVTETPDSIDISEKLLGTWNFGKAGGSGTTGDFNAKLTVVEETDEITVTVVESAVLTAKQPTLTVPCDFVNPVVKFGETELSDEDVTSDGENVTFKVAAAGEYVITKGEASDDGDGEGGEGGESGGEGGEGDTGSDTPGGDDTDRPIVPVIPPAIIPGIADIILGGKTDVVKRPASVKVDVMDSVVALDTIETQSSKIVFTDVAEADWFCGDVMSLVHKGIISGYPDGSFRPQGEVTWGEALKLVLLASRYGQQAPTGDHWASGYMDLAIKLGFISDPVTLDAPITRGEMADLTAAAMKLGSANISNPFDDEAPASALALYEAGIIKGSADNGKLLYRAESTITRAEMAAIIWRVYCAK